MKVQTRTQEARAGLAEERRVKRPVRICMHVLASLDNDVRVEREASTLVEHGYEVTVVDLARRGGQASLVVHKDIRVKHLPTSRSFQENRFRQNFLWSAAITLLRGVFYLVRIPTDIYHAHDLSALPATYLAALLRRKPLIYDAHELPLSDIVLKEGWTKRLVRIVLRYIVPRCAGVISVSPPIVREIKRAYRASNLTLVRNIPWYQTVPRSDKLRQHLGLSAETPILLYQGHLSADRRLDLLVRAAHYLQAPAVIVMMGKPQGETQKELEELIVSQGVEERVKIIPPVPYEDLLSWTSSADMGLIVYQPTSSLNVRWCLPNKFFEYIMAGLPVLASSLDAVREMIDEYQVGRIIPDVKPQTIASTIDEVLADAKTLEQMRQNALLLAKNALCWEKERAQLLALYERVCTCARL